MAALHQCAVTDLRRQLTPNELAAITTAVLGREPEGLPGEDQEVEEYLTRQLSGACDRVVASVNTCTTNPRIAFGQRKVPSACVMTALVLARHAVLASIPGMVPKLEGNTRAAEYQAALADLADIAACKLYVADYAEGDGETDDPAVLGASTSAVIIGEPVYDWL